MITRQKKKKHLGHFLKALQGGLWELEDRPDLLVELYDTAEEVEVEVLTASCKIRWSAETIKELSAVSPVFQFQGQAKLFIEPDHLREGWLQFTRVFSDGGFQMNINVTPEMWGVIKELSSNLICQNPTGYVLPRAHTCSCEGCAKKQARMRKSPKAHPLYFVLENIAYAREEFLFQSFSSQQRGIAMISPNAMRFSDGWCILFSPHCVVEVNLSQIFHIRIEQQLYEEEIHTVLEGRNDKDEITFRLSVPGGSYCKKWSKIISQADLIS